MFIKTPIRNPSIQEKEKPASQILIEKEELELQIIN